MLVPARHARVWPQVLVRIPTLGVVVQETIERVVPGFLSLASDSSWTYSSQTEGTEKFIMVSLSFPIVVANSNRKRSLTPILLHPPVAINRNKSLFLETSFSIYKPLGFSIYKPLDLYM
jgi:hypothetical protein